MGRGIWAALAALAAFAMLAGNAAAITNGKLDGGAHPNVGSLYATAKAPDGSTVGPVIFCSGSLVAPGVFLTAAHCIASINDVASFGLTDPHFFVSFSPTFDAQSLIEGTPSVDAAYTGLDRDPHDIAVVRFDANARAAAGIRPVLLPPLGFLDLLLKGKSRESAPTGHDHDRSRSFTRTAAPRAKQGDGNDWSHRDGNGKNGNNGNDQRGQSGGDNQRGENGDGLVFVDVGYGITDIADLATGGLTGEVRRSAVSGDPKLLDNVWLVLSQDVQKGFGGTCIGDSGGPQFLGRVEVSITITGDPNCVVDGVNLRLDTRSARAFLSLQGVRFS